MVHNFERWCSRQFNVTVRTELWRQSLLKSALGIGILKHLVLATWSALNLRMVVDQWCSVFHCAQVLSTNNARRLPKNWWIRQYLDGENLTAMDHASTTTTALANTNTCAPGSVAILFNKKTRERAPAASHRDLRRSSSRLSLRFGVWDPRKTPGSDFQFDSALLVSGSCVHNVNNTPRSRAHVGFQSTADRCDRWDTCSRCAHSYARCHQTFDSRA